MAAWCELCMGVMNPCPLGSEKAPLSYGVEVVGGGETASRAQSGKWSCFSWSVSGKETHIPAQIPRELGDVVQEGGKPCSLLFPMMDTSTLSRREQSLIVLFHPHSTLGGLLGLFIFPSHLRNRRLWEGKYLVYRYIESVAESSLRYLPQSSVEPMSLGSATQHLLLDYCHNPLIIFRLLKIASGDLTVWVTPFPEIQGWACDPRWPIRVFHALHLSYWFRHRHMTQTGRVRFFSGIFAKTLKK